MKKDQEKSSSDDSLYGNAVLYDILYTPGTATEINALEKIEQAFAPAKKLLPKNRHWFEPACGTGRYLRTAHRRGRHVSGFDLITGPLNYAKHRLPDGVLFQADMNNFLDAALEAGLTKGSVDFAFNPVNSLRHLETDQDMLNHFEQVAQLLTSGAIYVVGISLTYYDWLNCEEDLWEATRGRIKISQLVNYLPPEPGTELDRVEQVLSHLTVYRPSGIEHLDDKYNLRTYDLKQWQDLINRSCLKHVGSFDAFGQPLLDRVLPYQLEALAIR